MRERLEDLPGIAVLFTTPLGMRIDEGLGGTPADVSVRVFGPDLDELARLAEQAERIMSGVEGLTDLRAEALTGLPQLQIAVDRQATARVGLAPGDVIRAIASGWSARRVAGLERSAPLRPGGPPADDRRDNLEAIKTLLIDGHDGTKIPLGQLADITQTFGPASIRREAGTRRIAVEASVTRSGSRRRGCRSSRTSGGAARAAEPATSSTLAAGSKARRARRARLTIAIARGALWRVRAAQHRARVGGRGLTDPGDGAHRVRRRHPRAARRGRNVERVIAGRAHRTLRHRGAEQPRSRDSDRGSGAGGPAIGDAVREASIGRVRPKLMTAGDGNAGAAAAAGAAACTGPRSSGRWRS